MSNLLAVCILAKDEEATISSAIISSRRYADIVLVGDTGSTDGTKDIARSLGATVVDIPWEDNFAKARNALKSHTDSSWVLSLDADEQVDSFDMEMLRKVLEGEVQYEAFQIERRSYVSSDEPQYRLSLCTGEYPEMEDGYPAYISEPNFLLFRNFSDTEWRGAVHESVLPSLPTPYGKKAISDMPSLVVHNYGRERNIQAKREKYAELVKKRLQEDPRDPLSWFYTALAFEATGELEKAEKAFQKSLKLSKTLHSLYGLAMLQMRSGKEIQAELNLVEYLRYAGGDDANAWMGLLVCALQRDDMDRMDYYLGQALKSSASRKKELVRFALYAANRKSYKTKVELYEKLLKKVS